MTTLTAILVIVVALVVMGVGTYALMGGFRPGGQNTQCTPPTSPACFQYSNLHDVALLVPFKSVAQGTVVTATGSVPAGETATSYSFNWGDLVSTKSSTSIANHTYTTPGHYLLSATALVNGVTHDNLHKLIGLDVSASYCASCGGGTAQVTGTVVSNTTTPAGPRGISAVLQPGQSVTVSGSYTSAPTNPNFNLKSPRIVVSTGGAVSRNQTTTSSAQVTAVFQAPGQYTITFVGASANQTTTFYSNYTWSVYVSQPGAHAALQGSVAPQSPHPGTIVGYELAPGGGQSEDPAIDYETVGAEPIFNVYQTLVTYNGTSVGPEASNYVPVAATCVPGSALCAKLYGGQTLSDGINYTFVIQHNASFYDPNTGKSWAVYPSDVVFSIARTLGFSTLPAPTIRPGWIIAQALLDKGNVSWNSIHGAYNNTPSNILGSMIVNDTVHCPLAAVAAAHDNGCITFHAYAGHHAWPDFLELVADPLGGAIVPCGWFSARGQAAGIPYWSRGNISGDGDQSCPMPGLGMGTSPSLIPVTGWDQWEQLGSGSFNGQYLGNVQWSMVGSGPYYLAAYVVAASYTLKANPSYGSNPYCTWTGCPPNKNNFASTVSITWETTETPGEQAYRFGAADFASIPSTTIGLLLQLIEQGKVTALDAPTLNIGFYPFNMQFYLTGAQRLTTNPITVADDFFSYLGMREFFARAYPYQTIQNTINTRAGIQLAFLSGGAIPQFMGNYYPKDIPWPNTDPCSDVRNPACPAYWWDQMHNVSGPFYDPEAARCTANNPCQLPLFGIAGSPTGDQIRSIWSSSIQSLSGRAVLAQPVDVNFITVVIASESTAGTNPLPMYSLGWAPDYPDPTDYVVPLYASNSTYTEGDAVAQGLEQPQFAIGCAQGVTNYQYWANLSQIPQACQGVAYRALQHVLGDAGIETNLNNRVHLYDLAEKIAYNLCLYTYTDQSNALYNMASWVDIASVNTNVMTGGDSTFYTITGNGVQYAGSV